MKTLNLSIELSNIAIEAADQPMPMSQGELLGKVRGILGRHTGLLGKLTGSSKQQKSLGSDLRLSQYQFDYERQSVQVQFANFVPRGDWQLQGIRLF